MVPRRRRWYLDVAEVTERWYLDVAEVTDINQKKQVPSKQLHCSCWIKNERSCRNTCPIVKPLHTGRVYRSIEKTKFAQIIRNRNYTIFRWFPIRILVFSDYFPIISDYSASSLQKHQLVYRCVWNKLHTAENSYCGGHSQKISTIMTKYKWSYVSLKLRFSLNCEYLHCVSLCEWNVLKHEVWSYRTSYGENLNFKTT